MGHRLFLSIQYKEARRNCKILHFLLLLKALFDYTEKNFISRRLETKKLFGQRGLIYRASKRNLFGWKRFETIKTKLWITSSEPPGGAPSPKRLWRVGDKPQGVFLQSALALLESAGCENKKPPFAIKGSLCKRLFNNSDS